jgi:hypothetical protein
MSNTRSIAFFDRFLPFFPGTMAQKFPDIQPGGSLIVAWQVREKRILVVGGGEVS